MLGPLEVLGEESEIKINRARERKLLAVLLVDAGSPVSTDHLVDALWCDELPVRPEAALQTAVSRLRRAMESHGDAHGIRTGQGMYSLEVGPNELDSVVFAELVDQAKGLPPEESADLLRTGLAMWRGGAYADFQYDEFAQAEIRRLEELRLAALEARIAADLKLGRHREILGELQSIVSDHPLNERFREHLILALYQAGRQAEALRAFQDVRTELREQLGIDPGPALRRLEEAVLRQDPALDAGIAVDYGTPVGSVSVPPAAIARLVGREQELEQLMDQIRPRQVVCILGPPGVGKSRLALEVSNRIRSRFPDGVAWVSLDAEAISPPLAEVLTTALGLVTGADGALARLLDWARGREQLLVLDGCELALPEGLATIRALSDECPGLAVLVSTRQRLGIAAETVLRLSPLAVPAEGQDADAPAVELFIERALEHSPGLVFDADVLAEVLSIVRSVDGIPLGIELAAGRVRHRSISEIAASLESGLAALDLRQDTDNRRHESLATAIECSWRPLSGDAEQVLAALSVFKGPWTIDIAVALLWDYLGDDRVADLVLELADRSLLSPTVRVGPDGRAAFRMLDPLRRFAHERLVDLGLYEEMLRRHAYAGAEAASQIKTTFRTSPGRRERIGFSERLPDLRAAHLWLLEHDPKLALTMASHLADYCGRTQKFALGEEFLVPSLERAEPEGIERAEALVRLAFLRGQSTDLGAENVTFSAPYRGWRNRQRVQPELEARLNAAEAGFAEGIALYQEAGLTRRVARARAWYGWVKAGKSEYEAAEHLASQAMPELVGNPYDEGPLRLLVANLALAEYDDQRVVAELEHIERLDTRHEPLIMIFVLDTYGRLARANQQPAEAFHYYQRAVSEYAEPNGLVASALLHVELGFLASQMNDFATARTEFGRALSIGRRGGMPRIDGMVRIGQARLGVASDDLDEAAGYADTAFREYERLGDSDGIADALGTRAKIELRRGAVDVAVAYGLRGVAAIKSGGTTVAAARLLEVIAAAAVERGEFETGAVLLSAADTIRKTVRSPLIRSDPASALLRRIENELDRDDLDACRMKGGELSVAAAFDLAARLDA